MTQVAPTPSATVEEVVRWNTENRRHEEEVLAAAKAFYQDHYGATQRLFLAVERWQAFQRGETE